jgi:ribosome-binding protein aMBF1 (putative translation factor)
MARSEALAATVREARRVAWQLFNRAMLAHDCGQRLSIEQAEEMDIDQRILVGDVTAFYDAIVEARELLGEAGEELAGLLAGDPEIMRRLDEVRAASKARGSLRPKQDAAAMDRSGTERQRSRITRRDTPASHG